MILPRPMIKLKMEPEELFLLDNKLSLNNNKLFKIYNKTNNNKCLVMEKLNIGTLMAIIITEIGLMVKNLDKELCNIDQECLMTVNG